MNFGRLAEKIWHEAKWRIGRGHHPSGMNFDSYLQPDSFMRGVEYALEVMKEIKEIELLEWIPSSRFPSPGSPLPAQFIIRMYADNFSFGLRYSVCDTLDMTGFKLDVFRASGAEFAFIEPSEKIKEEQRKQISIEQSKYNGGVPLYEQILNKHYGVRMDNQVQGKGKIGMPGLE